MSGHNQAWSTRKKAPALEKKRGEFAEAEPLYDRSQAIRENVLGPEHADVATTLSGRAGLLERQGNYAKAESLYERSQAIRERVLGPEHPDVATMLNNLARLLLSQVTMPLEEDNSSAILDLIRAEIRLCRAVCPLHIMASMLRPSHSISGHKPYEGRWWTESCRSHMFRTAGHDCMLGYAEADPLYARCQTIYARVLRPEHRMWPWPSTTERIVEHMFLRKIYHVSGQVCSGH